MLQSQACKAQTAACVRFRPLFVHLTFFHFNLAWDLCLFCQRLSFYVTESEKALNSTVALGAFTTVTNYRIINYLP